MQDTDRQYILKTGNITDVSMCQRAKFWSKPKSCYSPFNGGHYIRGCFADSVDLATVKEAQRKIGLLKLLVRNYNGTIGLRGTLKFNTLRTVHSNTVARWSLHGTSDEAETLESH